MRKFSVGAAAWTAVGAGLLFFVGNRLSENGRGAIAAGTPLEDILPAFPGAVWSNLFHVSTDPIDLTAGIVAAVMLLLIVAYRIGQRKPTRQGEEHGSAGWATARELAELSNGDPSNELRFAKDVALAPGKERNLNVLVLGASGTRKTTSYLEPNLAALNMSTATTDPAGEIYRRQAPGLRDRGFAVRTLNLVDLRGSGKFNPFRYFSPEEPETSIAQLANCIMSNTTGKEPEGGASAFFEKAERALLTGLAAYVWATSSTARGKEANLPAVLDLQKGMSSTESDPDSFASDTDEKFHNAAELVAAWHAGDDLGGVDPRHFQVLDFACRQYRLYQQAAVETRMSIVISLGVRLMPLDMHDVRDMLATDDLQLDRVGRERTALFLQISDTDDTFRFIAAMFWQTLYSQSLYVADHQPDGLLPVPLHTFLDEFANIGKIPRFEQLIATIRKRGISVSIIVQSMSQGEAIWDKNWKTIVSNCDTTVFLGCNDDDTSRWMSDLLGEETVVTEETSRTYGAQGSSSRSVRTLQRKLMTSDEVRRLPNHDAIVLVRGYRPFRTRKTGS